GLTHGGLRACPDSRINPRGTGSDARYGTRKALADGGPRLDLEEPHASAAHPARLRILCSDRLLQLLDLRFVLYAFQCHGVALAVDAQERFAVLVGDAVPGLAGRALEAGRDVRGAVQREDPGRARGVLGSELELDLGRRGDLRPVRGRLRDEL